MLKITFFSLQSGVPSLSINKVKEQKECWSVSSAEQHCNTEETVSIKVSPDQVKELERGGTGTHKQ